MLYMLVVFFILQRARLCIKTSRNSLGSISTLKLDRSGFILETFFRWITQKIIEGFRKLNIRCEIWVQSETLYVTNSFKKSVPVTGFLGIPECRQNQCLVDRNCKLLWWRLNQWCALWSAICLETSWNTSRCEVPLCLAPKSTGYFMDESCLIRARTRFVRI